MQKRIQKMKEWQTPDKIIFVVLAVYLLVMAFLITDYGEAWDNILYYRYGQQSGDIYLHPFEDYKPADYGPGDTMNFGPFIVTLAFFLSKIFLGLIPAWTGPIFFRFCYFLIHLAGLAGFYLLAKRFFSAWISLGITLIFMFQPMLFGQAPFSPKDTTLMGMVTLAIYFGLKMVDQIPAAPPDQPVLFSKKQAWILSGLAVLLVGFIAFHRQLIQAVLLGAANSREGGFVHNLIFRAVPSFSLEHIDGYTSRIAGLALPVVVGGLALAIVLAATPKSIWQIVRRTGRALGTKYLIPAGILFGVSVSVRILGVLIGGIVLFVLLFQKPIRSWFFPLAAYSLTGLLAMYLTWPFLWQAPIERFFTSLIYNFDHHHSPPVFFNGVAYSASELPLGYVPTLIAIQLTIPLLVLAAAGLVFLLLKKRDYTTEFLVTLGIWFVLPFSYLLITRPELHGNIRHMFFTLPPLFLLAGFSLEAIYGWLKQNKALYLALLAVLLLPSIIHIVQYHPYEYVYYNAFVGGTAKGVTRFESDYLGTSLTDATKAVNEIAPPNSTVFVVGSYLIARDLIRDDINLINRNNFPDLPMDTPNTYLITAEMPGPDESYDAIYQIIAGGTIPLGGVYVYAP